MDRCVFGFFMRLEDFGQPSITWGLREERRRKPDSQSVYFFDFKKAVGLYWPVCGPGSEEFGKFVVKRRVQLTSNTGSVLENVRQEKFHFYSLNLSYAS